MKIQQQNEDTTKTSSEVLPSKVPSLGVFDFNKMITEVLLVLSLYLILFFVWWRSQPLIKAMTNVGDTLNDDEFFGDIVDTPKEGIEQHKKREYLKSVIDKGKVHLLGHKWTHRRVDKASDETINKTYGEYKAKEMYKKGEKTGKALGKHVINLYSSGISRWLKIRDVKKLREDIENDPIMKDQMAKLGWLLVCTFGNLLTPILIAMHTANNVDFSNEPDCPAAQHEQNEDHESKGP